MYLSRNFALTLLLSLSSLSCSFLPNKQQQDERISRSYASTKQGPTCSNDFKNIFPDEDDVLRNHLFVADAKAFQNRGGNLVLLRCPSTEFYRKKEENFYCRDEFWDELVKQSGAKGYHFEDYAQLKDLDCPEWSHLSGEDADYFTAEVAKIMMKDNAIPIKKYNK